MISRFLRVPVLAALGVVLIHGSASGMYHPTQGRFLQRDPVGADWDVPTPRLAAAAPRLPWGLAQGTLSTSDPTEEARCSAGAPDSLLRLLPYLAQTGRLAEGSRFSRALDLTRGPAGRPCPRGRGLGIASQAYPDGLNLYRYVADDPAGKLDPSGRFVIEPMWVQAPYGCGVYMGIDYTAGQRMHSVQLCRGWCRCYGCVINWSRLWTPMEFQVILQQACCLQECHDCDGTPAGLTRNMKDCLNLAMKVFLGPGLSCTCN